MKSLKKILGELIIILIAGIILLTDITNPIIEYLPILWTLSIIWSLIFKYKYRNGQIKNELRFQTKNDNYTKIIPVIIGGMFLVGGIITLLSTSEYLILKSILTLNGFLLIVSGFLFVPSGAIKIKNNKLISVIGNSTNTIETIQLNEINIFIDKIILIYDSDRRLNLENLNLNLSDFKTISEFLRNKLNHKVELKTYGNTVYS
tara:strand:+ start:57 stop:668 length:612 start_codon:yes stop_codon:yes gene_type:complete